MEVRLAPEGVNMPCQGLEVDLPLVESFERGVIIASVAFIRQPFVHIAEVKQCSRPESPRSAELGH